ncbi:MAG TPA: hypothetical protein VGN72_05605 [Tepidisphaeraceae bacterium]|jgi:hypothetical protein|nr:hypothetical protein [Tepidisphaeraceae bacterium]
MITEPIDLPLLCGRCRYDLRATPGSRCPECGQIFDPNILIDRLIPWEAPALSSPVRAYWRTVWIVSFQPNQLTTYLDLPVSMSRARSFAIITWLLGGSLLALVALAWAENAGDLDRFLRNSDLRDDLEVLLLNRWSFWLATGGAMLGLLLGILATRSFYFDLRDPVRHARATALSLYTCAPLAWLPVIAAVSFVVALGISGWTNSRFDTWEIVLLSISLSLAGGTVLLWWSRAATCAGLLLNAGPGRLLLTTILLPTMWIGCTLIGAFTLWAGVQLAWLMWAAS